MIQESDTNSQSLVLAFDAKRLFNNFTGLGNYSRTLVKNLQAYFPQHQYHLFTPRIVKNADTEYFLDHPSFTIHTPERWNPLWRSIGISQQINELKPHIYHGLSHELPYGIHHDTKQVVSFHDLIYEKFPHQFKAWDRNLYHWKYKKSVHRADAVIAISQSTKDDLIDVYGISVDKIEVIYQSCGEAFQQATSNKSIRSKADYYLYVGSIIERKGLMQCVLAYAKLPEKYRKKFLVIGHGDNDYSKQVREMIQYHRLESDFVFINGLSNADLVQKYDECFCLVFPSIYEGFGIPLIESLFRHKPVITSGISSLPEASGPGALLIDPYSPQQLADAMINMHDPQQFDQLADAGFDFVSKNFTSQITAENLMKYYLRLLQH